MMNFKEIGCDDGRWMKLTGSHVHWQALILVLRLCFWTQCNCVGGTEKNHREHGYGREERS
jgi:hypothetical protein